MGPLTFALLGMIGGLARATYGLYKAVGTGSGMKPGYFATTLVASAGIGALLGMSFSTDYRIAVLAGYVGTDILENVAKAAQKGAIALRQA